MITAPAFDASRRALVEEVDGILGNRDRDHDSEADHRRAFRRLGEARLLAVHWPVAFGGRGLSVIDHAVVGERLGWHGLPDVPHLVSIQGVGCTLMAEGSEQQRGRWLPALAAGLAFASLLLSEEGAGTNLGSVTSTAVRDGEHFVVAGEKSWNLFANWSTFGLCCVRTAPGRRAHDGLSLLLIPFDAPGVTVEPISRSTLPPYGRVVLDDVRVGPEALVGAEHRGLAPILRAIGFERAGFDYLNRAHRWLAACSELLPRVAADRRSDIASELVRHEAAVFAARTVAYRAVASAADLDMEDGPAAMAKVVTSEAAQNLAWWATTELLPSLNGEIDTATGAVRTLEDALCEAPELSVSGGANELHLDAIAAEPILTGAG